MTEATEHRFQAEVSEVLRLVINSLYSHKEIFLRELVSNASDALDKLRFRAIQEPGLMGEGETLEVRIVPDPEAGTLTVSDNGIGMSAEELAQSLGTIAWSGSRDFIKKLEEAQGKDDKSLQLIGQFGVGFYSAYLVADRVEVVSRAAGVSEASRWSSEARDTFSIEPAERPGRGTDVILHLKPEQRELADSFRLRELVRRYSDYVSYPIQLQVERQSGEGDDKKTEKVFETVNQASALWQRQPKDVTKEQYEEFYKHLGHDWEPPLAWKHFHIEGTQMFAGLLFVPRQRPLDLFGPEPRHGVRLHVRRVFVMDNCEELVPRWLRFVRGVIDSEDLPLNVSRELLQDSRAIRIMKKQVVIQTLDLLDELAKDHPEDYAKFWESFGAVLKEGLHFDPEYKERIAKLLRYPSTKESGLNSLDAYVERMAEGQTAIYYAAGTDREGLARSPHLEALEKRGYEVLYMTDTVDPFAVSGLGSYQEKPLVSAMNADIPLDEETHKKVEEQAKEAGSLFERFKTVLGDRVAEVRASERLTDSPACLVQPEGALEPHIERMLRAQQVELPSAKRILELNLDHPLLKSLRTLAEQDTPPRRVDEWIEMLYDQALLAEGSPIDAPEEFARRLADLLTSAASAAAISAGAK
jgi:molecular chaperone HtpG